MFSLMMFCKFVPVALAVSVVAVEAQAQVLEYNEMCEASAAVTGPDHFFAAEDEGSVVRLYARNDPKPIRGDDLGEAMGVEIDDIEAAASIRDQVYFAHVP